jgi:rSAM/selenodomain-associated transferase 1
VRRLVYYAPDAAASYFQALAPDFERLPQVGTSLGERLDYALTHVLAGGSRRVVVMDSDSPTLPAAFVAQAFDALADHEVVLGPCDDGGYYLIGLTRPQPQLLRNVQMSQPNVLRDTLALAEAGGLRVALLPRWYDVDTVGELSRLQLELAASVGPSAARTRSLLAALTCAQQR